MGAKSNIEWTDASWTPIRARNIATGKVGWYCEHSTTGCEFCYAEGMNKRLGTGLPFKPGHRKDVELFLDDKMLLTPLRWKKPRMIFVCSMTDLFADFVPDEWIDKVFAVMALAPQHTFQVLTKRAERMRQWFAGDRADCVGLAMLTLVDRIPYGHRRVPWPLPNVWLGVSAERQQEAEERIPHLLETRAAVRFVSAEPLLGPIDMQRWLQPARGCANCGDGQQDGKCCDEPMIVDNNALDWVIVGGESGKNARPMHPQWAMGIRDQCADAGVSFFFKQWGEFAPSDAVLVGADHALCGLMESSPHVERDWLRALDFLKKTKGVDGAFTMQRLGKKSTGRYLDGTIHNAMPQRAPA